MNYVKASARSSFQYFTWLKSKTGKVVKSVKQLLVLGVLKFPTILGLLIYAGPSTRAQSVTYNVIF